MRSHFRSPVDGNEQETEKEVEERDAAAKAFFSSTLTDFIWIKTGNSTNEQVSIILTSFDSLYVRSNDSDYYLCDDCNEDMKVYELKNHVKDTRDHRTFWRCTVSEFLTPDIDRQEYCEDCGSEDCQGKETP